ITGAGLALPQKGLRVLLHPGRTRTASSAIHRREDIEFSLRLSSVRQNVRIFWHGLSGSVVAEHQRREEVSKQRWNLLFGRVADDPPQLPWLSVRWTLLGDRWLHEIL